MHHLERAVALNPWSLEPRVFLMRLYSVAGRDRELKTLVAATLDIAPAEPTASAFAQGRSPVGAGDETTETCLRLGRSRMEARLWVDAALFNRRALDLDPGSATGWNNLGWALGKLGFHDAAVPCFREAIRLDPEMEVARGNLAWAEDLAAGSRGN